MGFGGFPPWPQKSAVAERGEGGTPGVVVERAMERIGWDGCRLCGRETCTDGFYYRRHVFLAVSLPAGGTE